MTNGTADNDKIVFNLNVVRESLKLDELQFEVIFLLELKIEGPQPSGTEEHLKDFSRQGRPTAIVGLQGLCGLYVLSYHAVVRTSRLLNIMCVIWPLLVIRLRV
ncbi:hypothetical protein F2P56_004395 [Juglans regia]|uniref:Uncharacterized protein n=1 Tax=Juglans regia TaxID=51240 RepID=A0A833Y5C2_JUGRE|nr:hypothetical protein F2P56_004395 [Juglans regia]